MKNFFIIFLLFLIKITSQAQDFTAIDNYAKSVRFSSDLAKLTDKLTSPYKDDLSKIRSIFVCLATNIEYDHKKLNKMKSNGYRSKRLYGSKAEIKAQRLAEIQGFIEETLEDKKGVCQDYAFLFQAMCTHAGIECEFVTGVGKNNPSYIGNVNMPSKHAWNAVKIDGKWALIDVTWSTGMGNKEDDFGKGFFNLPPTTMIMSHYPTDSTWQLLDSVVSKQFFADLPYLTPTFIKYEISDLKPLSGKIPTKSKFSFKGNLPSDCQIGIYKNRVSQKIFAKKVGDRYEIDLLGKSLLGNIDVCIMHSSGLIQPLYSLKVTDAK